MTTVIPLGDGSEIVVSSDLGTIRLSLWTNKTCLGRELDHAQAMETAGALIAAVRRVRRG
jgi:hypothetical protein